MVTKVKKRVRAPLAIDVRMRKAGFVPAQEAADALGVTLLTIHRYIRDKKIVGKSMSANGFKSESKNLRWYVDAAQLAKDYDGEETIQVRLTELARSVREARKAG